MIEKVISGGQIGADIAGLRAAQEWKLKTGGTAPKGFRTLNGRNYELGSKYGLIEHTDWRYPPRTRKNVQDSDGTVRFAIDFASAGERATLRDIKAAGKPYIDVPIVRDSETGQLTTTVSVSEVAAWVRLHDVRVLNVAGNGKEEIESLVQTFLMFMFGELSQPVPSL